MKIVSQYREQAIRVYYGAIFEAKRRFRFKSERRIMGTELKVLRFVSVPLFFLFAVTFFTPQKAYAEDKGQDLPNQKCQRNNTDDSTTTGQCSNVCKDLTVSTTKDVNSGLRTCQQKAARSSQWGLVAVTGNPSILFLRYNNQGEVQACALTKETEIECRHINVREVKTKTEVK